MTDPARRRWWKTKRWAAAWLLLYLPAAYYSAYLALMRPAAFVFGSGGRSWAVSTAGYPHPSLSRVFKLAEWVDRRIRPGHWQPIGFMSSVRQHAKPQESIGE